MRITFREVKLYATHSFKCSCGKRHSLKKKFYQTLNPFNKLPNGELKTSQDIYKELQLEISEWKSSKQCPHRGAA